MPRWMPVLGQDDVLEIPRQRIDQGHDLVAAGDGERPAGAEIVLYVYDDKCVVHWGLHMLAPEHDRNRRPTGEVPDVSDQIMWRSKLAALARCVNPRMSVPDRCKSVHGHSAAA